jgi:uncharacterized membrane protein YbaN (DUF454 family)
MKPVTKQLLVISGSLSVALGLTGMFIPLLPTTPFLLLAGVCFAKSSKRAHTWLLTNRWCGEYIRNYQEKKGISLKHKILSLSLLWLTIGYSILFIAVYFWLKLLLFFIAAGVTYHILTMNTCEQDVPENGSVKNIIIDAAETDLIQSENKQ